MKRLLWGGIAATLLTVVSGTTAFATATLELVSGGDTLYVTDGGSILCTGGTCATFGAAGDTNSNPGVVSVNASNFNGWSITVSSGGSNSPTCAGSPNGPGCLNTSNINAQTSGASTLTAYFGDVGFSPEGGLQVGFSSPATGPFGGTASQTAYAFTGASLPLGSGVTAPALVGALSPSQSLTGGGASPMTTGTAPAGNFDLVLMAVFTPTGTGVHSFNVNGSVSATTVPEPASVVLFGTVLALCASAYRRKRKLS